jgi:hypothetical protein
MLIVFLLKIIFLIAVLFDMCTFFFPQANNAKNPQGNPCGKYAAEADVIRVRYVSKRLMHKPLSGTNNHIQGRLTVKKGLSQKPLKNRISDEQ